MSKKTNPFLPHNGKAPSLKRNLVDMSRQSLFTTDWGKIYPFFVQECIPGDSFKIDSSVGFRAMQTKFPLQSRVRTSVSFYYVRFRTIWPQWEDYIFKTKGIQDGVVAPWLKIDQSRFRMLSTGGLLDALGVPTTIGQSGSGSSEISRYTDAANKPHILINPFASTSSQWSYTDTLSFIASNRTLNHRYFVADSTPSNIPNRVSPVCIYKLPNVDSLTSFKFSYSGSSTGNESFVFVLLWGSPFSDNSNVVAYDSVSFTYAASVSLNFPSSFTDVLNTSGINKDDFYLMVCNTTSQGGFTTAFSQGLFTNNPTIYYGFSRLREPTFSESPFVGNNPKLPLNALIPRAYEQVCNYYYRNDLNSPFMINGTPQYNKFIPTDAGGADTTEYKFHFHNWELDRFVSALPTPQFGAAPLVGLTYSPGLRDGKTYDTAEFQFQADDGKGTFTATLGVDDDGKVVDIADFDPELPSANLHQLQNMVNYGFSINTLRNVNSFQRFLENSMRRGLRYRNQLKSHFGVSVDYPDIDVPQYIGGFSNWAQSGQVTNMAELPDSGLGDYVGTLSGLDKSSRSINCYCPEHGVILGLYCIYPVPVYGQSIDKLMLKTNPFDYYQSEFGKIGFTPIHNSEVAPLQTSDNNRDSVFGYQKAWYDYLSSYDSVHGDFRTTLRDFLVQRLWDSVPQLSEDFVRVNPVQLNDIFTTRNIADIYGSTSRFLCSAVTTVTAKRPIPVHGVPSLE